MISSASENGSTFAVRDTAEGSKNRTIIGAVKALFRNAVKTVTGRDEEEAPEPRRRRRGETESDFQRLARRVSRRFDVRESFRQRASITSRYLAIPQDAYAAAGRYLSGTLDMLNRLNDDAGSDFDASIDTHQNHISPRL